MSMLPVGVKPSRSGEVALLEDPDHRAERRGEAEHVQQQRLHRHEQAAGHQEQQHERRQRDEPRASTAGSAARTAFVSTSVADSPATVNANGAAVARMSLTSCSPAAECGSMFGTTESQVPSSPASGLNARRSARSAAPRST